VRIVSVNIPARQLNVSPAEPLITIGGKVKTHKLPKKRQKGQTRKRSKRRR